MAVTPAYDLSIPTPFAASFTDGERAVSVATPIGNAPARSVRYLSKWFDFEGGVYEFKSLAVSAAAWLVSTTKTNGFFFHRSQSTDGVITKEIYLPRGRHRIDIILSNIATSFAPAYVAFRLRQGGKTVYTSAGAGWVFDSITIEDAGVPALDDYRLGLAVFSVRPNWKESISERLSYVSETFTSESDDEQRRSLRRNPRRSFEASFLRKDFNAARLDNFLSGLMRKEFLLPLWHEQYAVSGTLGSSVVFPAGSLAYREFGLGTLVLVSGKDPRTTEVLTIASSDTGTDTIIFTSAPVGVWSGARITPLRVARMLDQPQMDRPSDSVSSVRLRFTLTDSEKWPTPSWSDPPVFAFKVNWAEGITVSYDYPTANVIDNNIGSVEVFDLFMKSRSSLQVRMQLRGRQQARTFRAFIGKARGRAVRFWLPSQTSDIVPKANLTGLTIDVEDAGFTQYLRSPSAVRATVAVALRNAPTVYREVATITKISGGERIEFATAMPFINKADIRRMMFVYPARFDQDTFELTHLVDASKVILTSVVLRSSEPTAMTEIV